jgi:glycosyltransferase involved in cell wall biosynthesis
VPDRSRTGTIAIVPPRFGEGVVGGAEAVLGEVAHGLAARGWSVEVLTTCARDHYTWANEYPAGVSNEGPLTVRRFPTVRDTTGNDRSRVNQLLVTGQRPSITDQQLWLNDSFRVPELFHHVLDTADRYRAIVAGPYMFWTTFAIGTLAPDRTILMPCLHDEPEAYLDVYEPMVTGARGVWFLSDPERDLAARLFPGRRSRSAVVGAGITRPDGYDPDRFRARHGLTGPFAFYAGRREPGKGWERLLAAYQRANDEHGLALPLVTAGVGDPVIPPALAAHVIDLGYLDDADRNDAMAAASVYLQPSPLESFSRTVLEAWLAGTPVIANAGSAVVSWHVERSGAGLLYRTDDELIECLRFVADEPEAAAALARPGRDYVIADYDPSNVLDRIETTLSDWTEAP